MIAVIYVCRKLKLCVLNIPVECSEIFFMVNIYCDNIELFKSKHIDDILI